MPVRARTQKMTERHEASTKSESAVEKLSALRRLMRRHHLAAYIIPTEDAHLSEYVPDCWKRREWLSGFTGSAGDVVVTLSEAGLWTDFRYYLQAGNQLDARLYRLFRVGQPAVPTVEQWLASRLRAGSVVGADPRTLSNARAERIAAMLEEKGIALKFVARNLVDSIWRDRPERPGEPIVPHSLRFSGESTGSKLGRMRAEIALSGAEAQVVTMLDEIAWLFNIRSRDVEYVPLVIAYAIVSQRGAALYLDRARLTRAARRALRGHARLHEYDEIDAGLDALAKRGARVLVDPDSVNSWVVRRLRGAEIIFKESPIQRAKAAKNPTQVQGMRDCHVRDSVALVRFLHWIEGIVGRQRIREAQAADLLDGLRAEEYLNQGPSFASIVSFGPNGAVVHYRPEHGHDRPIRRRGILLVDSGGQYLDGTTDVTRTITLGRPTPREKEFFTRVLKAHIALATVSFPRGTRGIRLEAIAKRELWDAGLDYGHGTGHGVGHYLSVHEGPVGFGRRSEAELEIGNVISNEPGYYVAGRYGFRTENLVVVVRDQVRSTKDSEWMTFEPLTLCPIDLHLIERRLLTQDEKTWLNDYHRKTYRALARHLDPDVRAWLRRRTRPI